MWEAKRRTASTRERGDVAYHKNKVDRKFDYLINILGADHAGYIKRISSSVEAISGNKDKLICTKHQHREIGNMITNIRIYKIKKYSNIKFRYSICKY